MRRYWGPCCEASISARCASYCELAERPKTAQGMIVMEDDEVLDFQQRIAVLLI